MITYIIMLARLWSELPACWNAAIHTTNLFSLLETLGSLMMWQFSFCSSSSEKLQSRKIQKKKSIFTRNHQNNKFGQKRSSDSAIIVKKASECIKNYYKNIFFSSKNFKNQFLSSKVRFCFMLFGCFLNLFKASGTL